MTYIAAEPEAITAYKDQNGTTHDTREDALEANFAADLAEFCMYHRIRVNDLQTFAHEHPDMLRILVGDRDYT